MSETIEASRLERFVSDWSDFQYYPAEPAELGGIGSGYHGHKGIPGHRGGSQPTGKQDDLKSRFIQAHSIVGWQKARDWADKKKSLFPDDLDSGEISALEHYKNYGVSAKDLNRYLRFGEVPDEADRIIQPLSVAELKDQARRMDSAIAKASMPEDFIVYRALHGRRIIEQMKTMPIGGEFVDRGYASTSLAGEIASTFLDSDDRMQILIPKGTHGIYLDGNKGFHSEYSGEVEFLLPRNSRFTLLSRTQDNEKHWHYQVALVGQE